MAYDINALHINKAGQRFEMEVDGVTAFIEYKEKGKKMYLVHTETPPELEGRGVASALAEKTLSYLEQNHLQLVPSCIFIQSYLKKHPEWNKLVTPE